jgi:hypothetical protein
MKITIRNTRVGLALFAFFFVACGGDDKVGVTVHIGGSQGGSGGASTGVPGVTGGTSSGTTGGTSTTGGTTDDGGAGAGEVKINVGFNTCPNITIVTIDPVELEVGGDPTKTTTKWPSSGAHPPATSLLRPSPRRRTPVPSKAPRRLQSRSRIRTAVATRLKPKSSANDPLDAASLSIRHGGVRARQLVAVVRQG